VSLAGALQRAVLELLEVHSSGWWNADATAGAGAPADNPQCVAQQALWNPEAATAQTAAHSEPE